MAASSTFNPWSVFHIKQAPIPWRRLWGTGLTTGLGLVIGLSVGHLEWGIWAFMGGFSSLYVQNQSYRTRGITLMLVGLGLAAAMALGALSAVWWAMALALAFVSASSTYLAGAFDVPLPAGFMFVLVACISAALPLHPPGIVAVRVLCVLGGAALAWLIGMSDFLWNRHGPVAGHVSRAYRALARYAGSIGTQKARPLEYQTALAVSRAHRAALNTPGDSRLHALAVQSEHVFRAAIALSTKDAKPLSAEWVHLIQQMARHVITPPVQRLQLPKPGLERRGHHGQRWRETMSETMDVIQRKNPPAESPALYHPTAGERLRRALDPDSLVWPATLRIGLAVGISVVLAHFLGITHPFWVPLTCAAVLQGVSTVVITQRTLQRAVGTVLGLLLTGVVLSLHPIPAATALMVVVFQLLMLFFIAKNYGISVIFITAMALIIIYAGTHAPVAPMVLARFGDTILGGAIGLISAFALWGRASSSRLPAALSRAIARIGTLFDAILTGQPAASVNQLRVHCLDALLTVRHIYETALGELPRPASDESWPVIFSVERLGYLVIAVCESIHAEDPALARALEPIWDTLAHQVESHDESPLGRIPTITRYPAIEHQLQELADELDLLQEEPAPKSS